MAEHLFHLTAEWPGLRNGVGRIISGNLHTEVSIPPEMNGPGIGTNPDEMLLGAAATCYIITLAALMERNNLAKEQLTMKSVGVVDVTNGVITYKKINHYPSIILLKSATEKDRMLALKLTDKAELNCMISRALKGNVSIEVHPAISLSND